MTLVYDEQMMTVSIITIGTAVLFSVCQHVAGERDGAHGGVERHGGEGGWG